MAAIGATQFHPVICCRIKHDSVPLTTKVHCVRMQIITLRHSLNKIQLCRNLHVLGINHLLNHFRSSVYALTVQVTFTLHLHKYTVQPARNLKGIIHVNPPRSSGSLLEMRPDSRNPGSETEPPRCEKFEFTSH